MIGRRDDWRSLENLVENSFFGEWGQAGEVWEIGSEAVVLLVSRNVII